MIDIQTETIYPFREAVRFLPKKDQRKEAGIATLVRFANEGVAGIKLEYLMTGKAERSTSVEAIQRFFERVTAIQDGRVAAVPPPKKQSPARKKAIDAAMKKLMNK